MKKKKSKRISHFKKPEIRYFITIATVLLLVFGSIYFFFFRSKSAEAQWFDEDWAYRLPVTVTNAGSAQTDFQVSITLNTNSLISNSKMQSDCDDIRITNNMGKLLPYWIQTGTNACNSTTTKIWVKVPAIPTTGMTLYIYYGNPVASNFQNGQNTFIYFEDFSTLDWTTYGTNVTLTQPSAGVAQLNNPSGLCRAWAVPNSPPSISNAVVELRYALNSVAVREGGPLTRVSSDPSDGAIDGYNINLLAAVPSMGVWRMDNMTTGCGGITNLGSGGTGWAVGAGFMVGRVIMNGASQTFYPDIDNHAGTSLSWSDATYLSGSLGLSTYNTSELQTDWIFARKYAATEPSSVAGSEETGPGPIAFWRFEEGYGTTTKDNSPNARTGNITGATWQKEDMCLRGKCLSFDGNGDYVSIATTALPATGTLSMWVRPNFDSTDTTWRYAFHTSNNAFALMWARYATGFWTWFVTTDSTAGATAFSRNTWHNVVVTWGSGEKKLYWDGVLINSWGAETTTSGTTWYIGSASGGGSGFNGMIDEVKIYNYNRSDSQIKTDYLGGQGPSATGSGTSFAPDQKWINNGLVGFWKMDELAWVIDCATLSVTDSSGNGNSGKSCPAPTGPAGGSDGKFGRAGLFDGSNDYVDIPNSSSLAFGTGSFTVSAWFKTTDYTQLVGEKSFINKYNGNYDGWRWEFSNRYLVFYAGDGPAAFDVYCSSNTQISDNNWHLASTVIDRSNSKVYFYLDGQPDGSADIGATTDFDTAININIARQSWSSVPSVNMRIDDVRIYNRALDPKEARDLYSWAAPPVAYYNFEEDTGTTLYDRSGNANNSTAWGDSPTWTTGKFGGGLKFDLGSTDGVYIPGSASLNWNNYTMGFWIKFTNNYNGSWNQIIARTTAGGSDRSPGLWMNTGYTAFHWRHNPGNSGATAVGPTGENTNFTLNQWYYAAGVKNGTSFDFYVNGLKIGSTYAISDPMTMDSGGGLYIGNAASQSAGFIIDELKIYNYPRTQKQIAEDMNAGHPAVGSPVGSYIAYWKFDEGYSNIAYDMSANNNDGTLYPGGGGGNTQAYQMWENSGKFNKAMEFDGTDDYIAVANSPSLAFGNGDFSFSVWFKTTAGSITRLMLNKRNNGTAFEVAYSVGLCSNGLIYFHVGDGVDHGAGNVSGCFGSTAWNDGVWHHLAITGNRGGYVNFYVDGRYQTQVSIAAIIGNITSSNSLIIGAGNAPPIYQFTGNIDEIKIYPLALTENEVRVEYNRGAAGLMGAVSTDASGNPSFSSACSYGVPGDTSGCNAPIAEYKFEEKTGATVNDTSGNGKTATFSGSTSWTNGKYGSGIYTGATTSDYIYVTGNITLGATWTAEAWFKYPLSTTGATWNTLFRSNVNDHQVIVQRSDNQLGMYDVATSGWFRGTGFIMTTLSNGWHHIVVTGTGGAQYFYMDGRYVGATDRQSTSDIYAIGNYQGGSQNWGYVDQVVVYNYVRSAAQIAWDYNRGRPIAWWKFDECQGGTAYDMSDNNNDAVITIGAGGTQNTVGSCTIVNANAAWYNGRNGKFNSSLNFDGTDDYVSTSINNLPLTDLTIAFWANENSANTGRIFGYENSASGTHGLGMYFPSNTNPTLIMRNNGTVYDMSWGTITTGSWNHYVVAISSSAGTKLYLNGVQTNSNVSATAYSSASVSFRIGAPGSGTQYFNGLIDDARIYNYALTATQIKTLYNEGAAVRFGPASGSP